MSTIRRQSIISSGIVYFGFALGFLNTYLFTREGGFTQEQYGLTGTFIAIANIMYSFANLGMQAFIFKFYPYYKDNLPTHKNDMMTWALFISFIGFVLVMISGFIFKDFVIRKFGAHSPELITYYYWIFPFGFGLTMYSLLEAFAWHLKKSVLTNFLREVQFRLFTLVLIALSFLGLLKSFDLFIKLYAFEYILIELILLVYLLVKKEFYFTFNISHVTKKFRKNVFRMIRLVWGGSLIHNIANFFGILVIAAVMPTGLAFVGIFTLAQNIASLIQAPQRVIISASIGPLSRAWKDKDYKKIQNIYSRSSTNQLIFAAGMFVLIWINFTDGVFTFHLKNAYLQAQYVFLFIGLMRIVDMGTGVNSQIIATSTFWRFEFITGLILLTLTIFLSYIFTKQIGVTGPAIADLIALLIYNGIRYVFLLKKFDMQPFSVRSLYILLLAAAGYLVCHYLFNQLQGFWWIMIRSTVFIIIYLPAIIYLKISPDILPVWRTMMKRLKI
jgi:O-antigen/teichoic acid export membrane protein